MTATYLEFPFTSKGKPRRSKYHFQAQIINPDIRVHFLCNAQEPTILICQQSKSTFIYAEGEGCTINGLKQTKKKKKTCVLDSHLHLFSKLSNLGEPMQTVASQITFLPHFNAQIELQQIVLAMST